MSRFFVPLAWLLWVAGTPSLADESWQPYVSSDGAMAAVQPIDSMMVVDCLLPGQGTFDIDELMSRLLKAGYQGDAVIEVYRKNYDKYQDITTSLKKYSDYI